MTGSIVTSVRQVLQHWSEQGIRVSGVSSERLRDVERDLDFSIPVEMRSLYLQSDGTGGYDDEMLRLLPLAEWEWASSLASAGYEDEHADCLVFAEFSIWAHAYAVRRHDAVVVLIHGGRPVQVAASFDEFLSTYLRDPPSLFPRIP